MYVRVRWTDSGAGYINRFGVILSFVTVVETNIKAMVLSSSTNELHAIDYKKLSVIGSRDKLEF